MVHEWDEIMRKFSEALAETAQRGAFLALALSLLGLPHSVQADEAKVTVNTTVLKYASLEIVAQPDSVAITAADLVRGYVDVPVGAQMIIRSNTSGGYLLEFASQGDFMRQILVRGLNTDVQLSAAGGLVSQPSAERGMTKSTLALGFRFVLSESAGQGTYPWPMRVSVAPL